MGAASGINLTQVQKRTMGVESPDTVITDPKKFLEAFGDQPESFDNFKEYISHANDD